MKQSFVVIGAGIVGISTAIWLQRDGHQVTLIDKEGPAAGASSGNAGVMATGSLVPVTVPGLLFKAPKMLFSGNQPLFLRWGYLPKLMPFLFKYLKHANDKSVERIADGLNQLLHDTPEQHFDLAKGTPAEAYIEHGDYLYVYDNKAAFEADSYTWYVKKRGGVDFVEMDQQALSEYDSNINNRFGYGVKCNHHGKISDPGAYVYALAEHYVANGGDIQHKELLGFALHKGQCEGLKTTDGIITADKYILTSGAWSSAWEKELGVTVPMESERGYHVEFVNPSITLRSPMMVTAGKFVVHSMKGRMRCAGIVEFGGLNNLSSTAPIKLLKKQMANLFPDLSFDSVNEWLGHRPATADSLPVIGPSPNVSNVYLGYGHHHVGISGGPKTGRWLAKLAAGTPLEDDLSVYAANRKI